MINAWLRADEAVARFLKEHSLWKWVLILTRVVIEGISRREQTIIVSRTRDASLELRKKLLWLIDHKADLINVP